MSRIGRKPILIPKNIKVGIGQSSITIEGPKGKLKYNIPPEMKVEVKDNQILVRRPSDSKADKSFHGLTRSLISNMLKGVTDGFVKELEVSGVGFRTQLQGNILNLQLGFSHPVSFPVPEGISIETPKPTHIIVKGIDKIKVGEVAARIRSFYKPEPYKGKGVKYVGEYIKRKTGKAVA